MNDVVNLVEKALNDTRPIIRIVAGELAEITRQAERAILGLPIYQRDKFLVRPVVEEVSAADDCTTKITLLARLEPTYLRLILSEAVRWERYDRRKKAWVQTDPPKEIALGILARFGDWQFSTVTGVLTTPTLRPDGTILSEPGYDPATRLYLADPPAMPDIAKHPTRDDALAALALLYALLVEFPFTDKPSRSVALSALITAVARGGFMAAPLHASRSPEAGSGKSYLMDTVSAIAIGRACPVLAAGRNEEETEKRLGAVLLAGQPLICIDNVNGELGGDALCQAVERPIVQIRILGLSECLTIEPRSTLFLATGNNLTLSGDLTRRAITATLDPHMEQPETRTFERNPVKEVLADRGRYVAAALTICRAYTVAGRPGALPQLASFEGWSDTVRSALTWLDCADPVETLNAARAQDPRRAELREVLTAWSAAVGTGPGGAKTATQLIKLAESRESSTSGDYADGYSTDWAHPELREALLTVAGHNARIPSRAFGNWLRANKGKIADSLRLTNTADQHGHAARWWLEPISR